MGFRRRLEMLGFAAGLSLSSQAKAEEPPKVDAMPSLSVTEKISPPVSPGTPEQLIQSVTEEKREDLMKRGERIPGISVKKAAFKPDPLPGALRVELDIGKIDEARNIALKLAATPEKKAGGVEMKEGSVGVEVDL